MTNKLKTWLAIGVTATLAAAVVYGFRATITSTLVTQVFRVSPADNFKYEFETPLAHIGGLDGGGSTWMDHHDTYLRFQLEQLAHLKQKAFFQKVSNNAALIDFFKQTYPHDANSLDDTANLVTYANDVAPGKLKKCLVYNSRTGVHFFRVWK